MSSKTRIVVLHMKEIIYTAVFVILGILLILLLAFMFFPKKETAKKTDREYTPGIYTSDFTIGAANLEVEVTVDESHINAIRFSNLDESVTTMYPLIQPALESIADQIYEKQSLADIQITDDYSYTSQVIMQAIENALEKAKSEQ